MNDYTVKTDAFEGPLELLLDLIEKRKFFISDISLANVADSYLEHIKDLEQFPTANAANFLFVASTLVLIKSKALLPMLALTKEEEGDITDLERRLRLYQLFREAAVHVKERFGARVLFPQSATMPFEPVFSPHPTITLAAIEESLEGILARLPKKEKVPEAAVRKVISLEDMITNLMGRVEKNLQTSFREFAGASGPVNKEKRLHVIVGFLAMLELVKQGIIAVQQEGLFEDISMRTHAGAVHES